MKFTGGVQDSFPPYNFKNALFIHLNTSDPLKNVIVTKGINFKRSNFYKMAYAN